MHPQQQHDHERPAHWFRKGQRPSNYRKHTSYLIGGGEYVDMKKRKPTPIKMQRLTKKLGVAAPRLAQEIKRPDGNPISRSSISLTLNHGYIPGSFPDYREQVEAALLRFGATQEEVRTCWELEEKDNVVPIGTRADSRFIHDGQKPSAKHEENELIKEAEMLTPTTKKHFQIFRDPFLDDVQQSSDVFMSESHRYAHAAMVDAARSGGFVAVCGECGAGKSTMRRKLVDELNEAGDVRIIQPQAIDKSQLTSEHILNAIITDLDPDAKPKRDRESKSRQVRNALLASTRAGMRHVLIIEEAHDMSVPTMKQLKRLWEIEDGYKKVLGIILIGQPELQVRLNRQTHPEMREVILRCLIATLESLSAADTETYMRLKFERIGTRPENVITDGCVDAIMARLTGRNNYSAVYPLYINNLLAKAMNAAAQFGEARVTPEIIEGV